MTAGAEMVKDMGRHIGLGVARSREDRQHAMLVSNHNYEGFSIINYKHLEVQSALSFR